MPCSERIEEKNKERELLTIEEQKKLFATPYRREDVRIAFIFSCLTGLRMSDVLALCPKHIKQSPDSKSEFIEIVQEKTEETVVVPLLPQAKQYLNEGKEYDEPYLTLPSKAAVSRCIDQWVEKAWISKHITFHCLRHTFGTLLVSSGGEIKTVSSLLGHASVDNTQIYTDVDMRKKEDAMSGLAALFG